MFVPADVLFFFVFFKENNLFNHRQQTPVYYQHQTLFITNNQATINFLSSPITNHHKQSYLPNRTKPTTKPNHQQQIYPLTNQSLFPTGAHNKSHEELTSYTLHPMTLSTKRSVRCQAAKSAGVYCTYQWFHQASNIRTEFEGSLLHQDNLLSSGTYQCLAHCVLHHNNPRKCVLLADRFQFVLSNKTSWLSFFFFFIFSFCFCFFFSFVFLVFSFISFFQIFIQIKIHSFVEVFVNLSIIQLSSFIHTTIHYLIRSSFIHLFSNPEFSNY